MCGYRDKGYLVCGTLSEVEEFLGDTPVLSPLNTIEKVNTRRGRRKRRLIVDSKRPGISATTGRSFKGENRRAVDLVHDGLVAHG